MISLYNEKLNIEISLEGLIKEVPKKINYSTITTNRGMVIQEFTRGVVNMTLDIYYISNDEYEKLKTMFLYSDNKFLIENLDDGKVYKNYAIEGDTLSLSKEQDVILGEYYYKGGISLCKL